MSSPPPPPQSTRLENLHFESDGAHLEFDGRVVRIKQDLDPASVAALRGFYQSALAEFHARPAPPSAPGWFSRVTSWLGRIFQAVFPSGSTGPAPAPALAPAAPPPPPPASRPAAPPPRPAEGPPAALVRKISEPTLRAVFADQGGVHLLWQTGSPPGAARQVEMRQSLDSDVARRLQDCYGHLDRLGYKIVGLDLLRAAPPAPEKAAAAAELESAAPSPTPIDAAPKPAEKKDRSVVMRLHPDVLEQPERALVSPVDDPDHRQILVAPERLLRSVRTAADASRPAAERVTYLRCTTSKAGLKLTDVGLGEGRGQAPARWVEAAKWAEREAEAAPRKGPPVAEPELNL